MGYSWCVELLERFILQTVSFPCPWDTFSFFPSPPLLCSVRLMSIKPHYSTSQLIATCWGEGLAVAVQKQTLLKRVFVLCVTCHHCTSDIYWSNSIANLADAGGYIDPTLLDCTCVQEKGLRKIWRKIDVKKADLFIVHILMQQYLSSIVAAVGKWSRNSSKIVSTGCHVIYNRGNTCLNG